jgi:hypothetical protein
MSEAMKGERMTIEGYTGIGRLVAELRPRGEGVGAIVVEGYSGSPVAAGSP